MRKNTLTEEQIIVALRQAEAGTSDAYRSAFRDGGH